MTNTPDNNDRHERALEKAAAVGDIDWVPALFGSDFTSAPRAIEAFIAAYLSEMDAVIVPREREWRDISTYAKEDRFTTTRHVLCAHSEKKWIRMGRWYPEVGKWYYSGTNERSQWAQVEGDAPTHWQVLPEPPKPHHFNQEGK